MANEKIKREVRDILKPLKDNRSYRGLELCNGLKVLLVSDPTADKASAALDVNIGAMSDPVELPGLAHFCEHMLFLGTEKYPIENHYDKFLSEHGGSNNAHTTGESTNYFFDISPEFLSEALDIFAQFFIGPLFTQSATNRELNAINSENDKNLKADSRRMYQLEKSLCKPGHDYSKFSTGNRETLDTGPKEKGIDVREELLKFHGTFYSSNIMALSVLGKESLDELSDLVTRLFSGIVNKNITPPSWDDHPFGPDQSKKILRVVPVKDIRTLTLTWPIPDLHPHYKSKPGHYLSHLIGHEGEGSLLSELKKRGWVNNLSSGENSGAKGFMFFIIDVDLTETGIDHVDEIVSLAFQYINMLKQQGVQEWVFKECQEVCDMEFKYKDTEDPSNFTCNSASIMQICSLEDVLTASYLHEEFKPQLIESITNLLSPDLLRLRVVGKKFESVVDSVERWYDTQYKLDDIPESTVKQWQEAGLNACFHLPPRNQFIPSDLSIHPLNDSSLLTPTNILESRSLRLWFCRDNQFLLPKSCFVAQLFSARAYSDPLSKNYCHLFSQLLKDALNEFAYAAGLAGIAYDVHNNLYGIQVNVSGYNDKQGVLLTRILEKMCLGTVDETRFNILLENYVRSLKNFETEQPYQQAAYYTSLVVSELAWTKEELLENTESMTYEGMLRFIPEFFSQTFVEALAYGNITEQKAKELVGLVESSLHKAFHSRPLPHSQQKRLREVQLPDGVCYKYSRKNTVQNCSGLEVYLQCFVQQSRDNMLLELLAQIINEPAYDNLRTQEQLGYIVFSGIRRSNGVQGLRVIVQSERSPAYVESRVEVFLDKMKSHLAEMDESQFQTHVHALASKRLEKPKKIRSQNSKYWSEISNRFYHFNRDEDEVRELRGIKKEEVIKLYNELIVQGAPKRHKLSVHVVSTHLPSDEQPFVEAEGAQVPLEVCDLSTFKERLPLFQLPPPAILLAKSKL